MSAVVRFLLTPKPAIADRAGPESAVVALAVTPGDATELLEGIREQRPAAVAELFDRYDGPVRRMLTRTLGGTHDLDDLSQETFLTVIRRIHTLRDPTALHSFVLGIAIRLAQNELRKRRIRRFVGLDAPDAIDSTCVTGCDPEALEGVRCIYRALDTLDSAARVLFVLRHVEGCELTELGKIVGCSLATVKRRLARAERRFEAIASRDPVLSEWLGRARA